MRKKKPSIVKLSIVIPCYNEEHNIPLIIKRFERTRPKSLNLELRLVDNGSSDNTNKVIRKYMKKYDYLEITEVKHNQGYGYGIWSGLKQAKGEFLCWTHGDMQTDIYDAIKAYRLMIKQKDYKTCFVTGSRIGRPLIDQFFTMGMSVFESILLQKILSDINAQPKLFHRSFIEKINDPPKDWSFDLYFYFMAKKMRYRIIKIPVVFAKRIHGTSHWNDGIASRIRFTKRTMLYSINLRERIK